jgi:hypothetical protein
MGETRRRLSGVHLLSLLSVFATLSRTGFAATERHSPNHAAATPPTQFTRGGAWVVGLEGLLDLTYSRQADSTYSGDDGNGNAVQTKTATSFLSLSTFTPKVALDAFIIDHVSVGLTASFEESNTTTETSGAQSYWNSQTEHWLDITPRVGLAYADASGVGVWIRGGVSITSTWFENAPAQQGAMNESSAETFSTRLEVLGAFAARRDVVLCLGPWVSKIVGSTGDGYQGAPKPEDAPPAFGVMVSAGLVL